ncbi:unnamed protein product, partial [Meganyctiphanes norvegica]
MKFQSYTSGGILGLMLKMIVRLYVILIGLAFVITLYIYSGALIRNVGFTSPAHPIHEKIGRGHKKKRLPQAIIIGAKKCGTMALMSMISLHPQVAGTQHEMHFFERNIFTGWDNVYQRGLEWYRKQMPQSYEDQITMEKTPYYFVSEDAPKRIYEMNSSIKLILIVREPTTRIITKCFNAIVKK